MADDYQDLGTTSRFPLTPNWISSPDSTLSMSRVLTEYRGSAQHIKSIIDDVPIVFSAKFLVWSKSDEYDLIDFFNARKGKNQRFWIRHPRNHFELKEDANNGAVTLVCNPNSANSQYQGYERIYVLMNDGDVFTRKVNSVSYNSVDDDIELTLNVALDRDLSTTNHHRIGRMLLVRFDSDDLEIEAQSRDVSEFTFRFRELVKEYTEA